MTRRLRADRSSQPEMPFERVFIANRGEVAVRIIRACRKNGIGCVLGYSEADRDSSPTKLADTAICIGPPRSSDSYLNVGSLLAAALVTGCDAVHPGYGFVAESASFAEQCAEQGLVFIGPSPEVLRTMGDKSAARSAAIETGLPVLPGSGPIYRLEDADLSAIGFPMMLKAVAGGGGRGIRLANSVTELQDAFAVGRREAEAAFGDPRLYLERYVSSARHLEVQVVADRHGHVVHLGERECSLQRRHQKVLEEAPALIDQAARERLCGYAVQLARSIGYTSIGTVEFLYDDSTNEFWFMEMNPRLQVEHGVTEMITQFDLVSQQIRSAYGEPLAFGQDDVLLAGHAIEWRVTAECAEDGFSPRPGKISRWVAPEYPGVRTETHCFEGYVVPPFYDSLLAKLIAHGPTRQDAIKRLFVASSLLSVEGVPTTLSLCHAVLGHDSFRSGVVNTTWLDETLEELVTKGRP